MAFWRRDDDLGALPRELSRQSQELGAAVDRFARELQRKAARRAERKPRVGPLPTRLAAPQVQRPTPHRLALPQRHRAGTPPTVLERRRQAEALRRGGKPPLPAAVEAAAERAAAVLRGRLLALRNGLGRLRRRWGGPVR